MLSEIRFEDTFEKTHWRKAKPMQPMFLKKMDELGGEEDPGMAAEEVDIIVVVVVIIITRQGLGASLVWYE